MENSEQIGTNLVETDIKIIGDRTTTCLIVLFLAYVRNAIHNNKNIEIKVNVGSKVLNGLFLFDVNGLEIPDLIVQEQMEIN